RDSKTHAMSFHRGEPGTFDDRKGIAPNNTFTAFSDKSYLREVAKLPKGKTGSRVRFWPDKQIFVKDSEFVLDEILARARQTAFLVPGLKLVVSDERTGKPEKHEFFFQGGIIEFVDYLAKDAPLSNIWRLSGTGTYNETVPVLNAKGNMESKEVERKCEVDVVVRWGSEYDTNIKSFVNIIATPKGGTHMQGFEQALLKVFRTQAEANSRKFKLGNDKIEKDDVLTGLTAVVTVRLPEPQFEGQTKEILGTPAIKNIVANVVTKSLTDRFNSSKRDDKNQTALILEKVVNEMKSRVSARTHKETQRRKTALESSSLPTKLVDCRTQDTLDSELIIVEGESALGTAKLARNSEYQALLPIRGKILNVQKAAITDMLNNAECASIIQVLGAGSGRTFELASARYGKIILMSDADVDGAHIRTLLLTLFYKYMRPLVEDGRVFAAVPPLHRVVIVNPGSKANEVVYTYSQSE
ncbi:MAG: DNA topoisomerase IV subunit B, partial [Actinobacteria bacterium]|nr:DNA topoisomerase IV subunit B [Actinomycetota bacterium]